VLSPLPTCTAPRIPTYSVSFGIVNMHPCDPTADARFEDREGWAFTQERSSENCQRLFVRIPNLPQRPSRWSCTGAASEIEFWRASRAVQDATVIGA
jgi:hypothetical protein